MEIIVKLKERINRLSKLDIFLLKSGLLTLAYFVLQMTIKYTPFFRPVFRLFRRILTRVFVESVEAILRLLNYDVRSTKNVVYIAGSNGVQIINACLGWSIMALFIGFVFAYPSQSKPKLWFIPLGLCTILFFNVLRLTGMAVISYVSPGSMDFYHHYIFKIILYLVVFILWIIWIKKYGKQKTT
jgi:exosortase family protein XrtF